MLENLQNLVKQHVGEALTNNPEIPDGTHEEIATDASSSIVSGVKTMIANGNMETVMSFFKGGAENVENSPVTHDIQSGFVNNLIQKFGLDKGKAAGIAATVIPLAVKKFVSKTNDPNDKTFDLQNIIGQLTGGEGIGSLLNKFGEGGDKDGGGAPGAIKSLF
jgi:uncharacterized protein YidB (DUF937 family)